MNVTARNTNRTSTKHRKNYAVGSSELVVAAILICPTYQYDTIDLFGKTAQRKNVLELKEVGKI